MFKRMDKEKISHLMLFVCCLTRPMIVEHFTHYFNTHPSTMYEGLDGGGGLVFTFHKKICPLLISLKFWVIH